MPTRDVPPEIQHHAAEIAEHLARFAEGDESADPEGAFAEAFAAAAGEEDFDPYTITPRASDVCGENMGRLRREAGWTQAALAKAMTDIGHPMSRGIVAGIEGGARRLALDELWSLAVLFQVPLHELLLPEAGSMTICDNEYDHEHMDLTLLARQAREIYFGRGGVAGSGAPAWRAAASAIPKGVVPERPAKSLWRNRTGGQA